MAGWAGLVDLVLPAGCAGCGAERIALRYGVCAPCAEGLESLRPGPAAPTPVPPGLPPCTALGAYDGALREVLLGYKERGRHGLAVPLGALLADVVGASLGGGPGGVLLVPVPDTAKAARARHGDHMVRLARRAAARLRRAGWSTAVARPVRALPRTDSAELGAAARAAAAESAFRIRAGRVSGLRRAATGRAVVVVDDIVTTGVTLAAVSRELAAVDVLVDRVAVLAATQLRYGQ
ncbi:ComF family protein [Phytohabitans sp. ZYX-F-186]|uniref:ComF family protein n=1 Tax=Phytohabitans maris TaxID=3071409 RepID=A0ABU0ZL52_9ACTN|nr:phosphoribosyltransferase family protein [Phytohabitans sp. ZYX-F-186]MDQ7907774.1 ComF family protein [Phytohabitans sp. ZYX-F-186]